MIIYAHMLDASSTYIGVDWFSYYEKHVVPTFLIDLTGSAAIMFPLKLLILLPVLSMIDRSIEDPSLRNLTQTDTDYAGPGTGDEEHAAAGAGSLKGDAIINGNL